jgi:hypothetical protein
MSNSFTYSISLLVIMMTASFVLAAAQEDNKTILNNYNLNNSSLRNASVNLLTSNSTDFNANDSEKVDPIENATFIIGSNVNIMPANCIKVNASVESSEIQPPKKTIFMIDFDRPKKSAFYENLSSRNAAYLSRKVEGTPHGYVTYYN